jgi:hypothetical protein
MRYRAITQGRETQDGDERLVFTLQVAKTALNHDFLVVLGARGTFATEFIKTGNRLRARGEIRAFYEMNSVKEGDIVVLFETATGQWSLETKAEYDKQITAAAPVEPEPPKPSPVPKSTSPKATKSRPAPVKAGTPISEA